MRADQSGAAPATVICIDQFVRSVWRARYRPYTDCYQYSFAGKNDVAEGSSVVRSVAVRAILLLLFLSLPHEIVNFIEDNFNEKIFISNSGAGAF